MSHDDRGGDLDLIISVRLEFFHHDKSAQEESTSSHAKTIEVNVNRET